MITYKSGTNRSQIDIFLVRKHDRLDCKDCKVIPGESSTKQHRLVKIRERKSRDLDHVKCIKSNDQKALVKDNGNKERWREYFSILLNEDYKGEIRTKEDSSAAKHTFFVELGWWK